MKKSLFILLISLLIFLPAVASIKLPALFNDGMVLQQRANVSLWGTATNRRISIITSWNKKVYTAQANNQGDWKCIISTPPAGGPYQIVLNDGQRLVLKDILIGEVWLCSGQSNMEM